MKRSQAQTIFYLCWRCGWRGAMSSKEERPLCPFCRRESQLTPAN